jgi:hypothetical protein
MSTAKDTVPAGFSAYNDTLNGVYYGPKCVETAPPKLLDALGAKRALVVTGETFCNKVAWRLNHF